MLVSFHYGAYRTLPLRILSYGCSVCVLLSSDVYPRYEKYYKALIGKGEPKRTPARLYLVKAEDPALFFKLRSMAKAGIHLFVYADGGKGARHQSSLRGQSLVHLGEAALGVRSGFLDMAYLLGLDVHLLMDLSKDPLELKLNDTEVSCYKIEGRGDRPEYIVGVLQALYKNLYKALVKDPAPWEALMYLHRQCVPKSTLEHWEMNHRLVGFTEQGKGYIMDRFTYRIHPLQTWERMQELGSPSGLLDNVF